ncbi:Na(+)/H(+) antiporter NhaB [Candidatus Arsenophonus lipoptenae]|uniref:Na(+)/H(+) antiporter NhaB n=1 Tax=Candidatus Arsenophonus lipoptenae TaxID=634113 RepID=A0A0X9W9V2_9GAMM|nr:sodium/proton antiporter NhaB [Candidatus Arsenophonus lipoptenae]AMA64658.1 Na(+)/H(+) antiporter NhaB [Candidatus Arsenophonus lipoptenae]
MNINIKSVIFKNFLGDTPEWYKFIIIIFLIINPICYFFINNFISGWLLIIEFLFTLTMALKCYPLQPGGLLAIEAIIIGMTSPKQVSNEIANNIEVILLLIFMVAGIYFMKQLLLNFFTKLILSIHSKRLLSLTFFLVSTLLSAFLDALTVIAAVISVAVGFYSIYDNYMNQKKYMQNYDSKIITDKQQTLKQFQGFLRNLMMHTCIGSALGGVMTMVGEPQNLIIAKYVDWNFCSFFLHMIPITLPVYICGIIICYCVEYFKLFGYGIELPKNIYHILQIHYKNINKKIEHTEKLKLISQALIGIWLIISLAFHVAEAGLIGLSVIILITTFCGITDEQAIGKAFKESLPFTALLIVFFSIVAVIIDQNLFTPFIKIILQSSKSSQLFLFYLFNGLLSAISDNVFVGTVYINEAINAFKKGLISREQYEYIAVAINIGTNLPSIATPNGQAAFLFLLTSVLSPLIKLSYGRMVIMAIPYTIILTVIGLIAIEFWLIPITELFALFNWIHISK